MNSDVKLRLVGDAEPEENLLPRGVVAVVVANQVFFVQKIGNRMIQLPLEEQERLREKHIV
jgi:hypothetical protein